MIAGNHEVYINVAGYYPEIYNNTHCDDEECIDEVVTPIVITDNHLTNIDFSLDPLETVLFSLTSTTTNEVDTGYIHAYNSQGNFVNSFYITSNILLPAGDYYFYYSSDSFVPKVYGGVNCFEDCDPTTGSLVTIGNNSNITLNMNLDEFFYLDVISTTGNASINLYNTDLTDFESFFLDNGHAHIDVLSDKYLRIYRSNHYPKIYDGIDCYQDSCDLTQATAIHPQINSSLEINLDDLLPINGVISGVITDSTGQPLDNIRVELLRDIPNYDSNIYDYTNENGEYVFTNKVAGDYYIKAIPGYSSQLAITYYGNIACHIHCDEVNIPALTMNIGEDLTDRDIQLLNKGSVSGEGILDVDLQSIVSTLYVFEVDEFNSDDFWRM